MIAMLRLQFIIFSLIGIGFVTRKKGIVSREGQRSITDLVINVVLPCNIVTSFVQELPDSALRDCAMIFLISVGMEAMCMLYSRIAYRNVEANKQKCLTYGILVSNAGFLGNPVAEGVYGPMGLMLASVYLIPVRVIMWSKGIAIFSGESDRRQTLRKVVTHPCVIACMIGIVIMLADLDDGNRHDPVRHRYGTADGQACDPLHLGAPGRYPGHPWYDPLRTLQAWRGHRPCAESCCPARSNARSRDDQHALVKI